MATLKDLIESPYGLHGQTKGCNSTGTKIGITGNNIRICDTGAHNKPNKCEIKEFISPYKILTEVQNLMLITSELNLEENSIYLRSKDKGELQWYLNKMSDFEEFIIDTLQNYDISKFEYLLQEYKIIKNDFMGSDFFRGYAYEFILHKAINKSGTRKLNPTDEMIHRKYEKEYLKKCQDLNDRIKSEVKE